MAGPHFLVDVPPHRRTERDYALSVLLADWLEATYSIRVVDGLRETRLQLAGDDTGVAVVLPDVLLAETTSWLTEESLPAGVPTLVAPPEWTGVADAVPLLFPVGDQPELVQRAGPMFSLGFDLLGSLFFMLTRYEEYVQPDEQDVHGRFPAAASIAARQGWLEWPLLDVYVHILIATAQLAWPRLELNATDGQRVRVSHDIDHPSSGMLWLGAQRFRVLAGDLVRRRDPGLALRRARAFAARGNGLPSADPFNTFDFLMSASEDAGVRSTFFFLPNGGTPPDGSSYRLEDPWADPLLNDIARRGHAIGLHASYASFLDAPRIATEWSTLAQACADLPEGVLQPAIRQHFLRWRASATWVAQEEAGLLFDETLGFADAIGYRAGTARTFRAYDLEHGRPLAIRVRPLHVMDATLVHYLAIGEDEALGRIGELASRTRRFGGELSLLWHNSSLESAAAKHFYAEMLRGLST